MTSAHTESQAPPQEPTEARSCFYCPISGRTGSIDELMCAEGAEARQLSVSREQEQALLAAASTSPVFGGLGVRTKEDLAVDEQASDACVLVANVAGRQRWMLLTRDAYSEKALHAMMGPLERARQKRSAGICDFAIHDDRLLVVLDYRPCADPRWTPEGASAARRALGRIRSVGRVHGAISERWLDLRPGAPRPVFGYGLGAIYAEWRRRNGKAGVGRLLGDPRFATRRELAGVPPDRRSDLATLECVLTSLEDRSQAWSRPALGLRAFVDRLAASDAPWWQGTSGWARWRLMARLWLAERSPASRLRAVVLAVMLAAVALPLAAVQVLWAEPTTLVAHANETPVGKPDQPPSGEDPAIRWVPAPGQPTEPSTVGNRARAHEATPAPVSDRTPGDVPRPEELLAVFATELSGVWNAAGGQAPTNEWSIHDFTGSYIDRTGKRRSAQDGPWFNCRQDGGWKPVQMQGADAWARSGLQVGALRAPAQPASVVEPGREPCSGCTSWRVDFERLGALLRALEAAGCVTHEAADPLRPSSRTVILYTGPFGDRGYRANTRATPVMRP